MTDEQHLAEIETYWIKHGGLPRKHISWLVIKMHDRDKEVAALAAVLGPCASGTDGECNGDKCPQEHDSRKHYQSYCPRARYWEAVREKEGYESR